jgi:DNA polymerase I-like protein with 3'-5' exonuclease and polymerase domains
MKTKIINQVHDSMVLDIHPSELKTVIAKIKEIIAVDLLRHWKWIIVPMNVEVELAPPNRSWHEIVKVDM